MTFNKIQLLRNVPIKIERDVEDTYLYVQGPTIGELYDNDTLFFLIQIILMTEEKLKEFVGIDKSNLIEKDQIINLIFTMSNEKEKLLDTMKLIIPGVYIDDEYLFYDKMAISLSEWDKIKKLLEIIMGEKKFKDYSKEEKEMSDAEKRMAELEKKIQEKKNKQKDKEEDDSHHVLEDIMISITYEFGFSIEDMMKMNYFTLIWYYSYTSKIHVYRINQFALSSGMIKKVNTDYFTNIK